MATLHFVHAPASDLPVMGEEPVWHDKEITDANYNVEIVHGLNWHNYVATDKNCHKYLEEWLKEHGTKSDIANWKNVSSSDVRAMICKLARINMQGFPLSINHRQQIIDYVASLDKKKVRASSSTPNVQPVTIQDRIRQQVSGTLSDLDVAIDNAFENDMPDVAVLSGDVLSKGFKGPQLKLVQDYLERNISEWQLASSGDDEQLTEGYAYTGKKNLKNIIDTFQALLDAVSQQHTKIKSGRVHKKRPVDKRKMAGKLRFAPEFTELNLKSVAAVDIIGADAVWVYDTKKRKLGCYQAEVKGSLYMKGTKIVGFKETCVKTLRKPEEQLQHVLSLRKNQTMNWFDAIKAKCGVLNGRTHANLILLRID